MQIDIRNTIAKKVATLIEENSVVNLGIGIPTLVVNHIDKEKNVTFHTENGIIGMGEVAEEGKEDVDIFDPGSNYVTIESGGTFIDSAYAFGLIRGGHVDVTVLGALQVDEKGNLSNWIIPNRMVAGFGGAMDLIASVHTVIVAMEHTSKGKPKILKECTFPLTGENCVKYIVTEMGVMELTPEGIILKELADNVTVEDIQAVTDANLIIPDSIGVMETIIIE